MELILVVVYFKPWLSYSAVAALTQILDSEQRRLIISELRGAIMFHLNDHLDLTCGYDYKIKKRHEWTFDLGLAQMGLGPNWCTGLCDPWNCFYASLIRISIGIIVPLL